MNHYSVTYWDRDTCRICFCRFEALSISHLIDVLENTLGYVPEVTQVTKL